MSDVVAVALLLGLILVGVVLILLFGGSILTSAENQAEFESAERTFEELDSELRTLPKRTDNYETRIPAPGTDSELQLIEDGKLSFRVNDVGACSASRKLGTIRYTNADGRTLGYQANGLWRQDSGSNETLIHSPPELDYETRTIDGVEVRTLSFPFTNVNASASNTSAGSELVAEGSEASRLNVERQLCLTGPKTDNIRWVNNVTIRVENSSYYRGWETYFREEFTVDGTLVANVTVDDANNTVVAADIPLGTINDDDNDGYPDPNVVPWNQTEYLNKYAGDPTIDNCPPEAAQPGENSTNRLQKDTDGDGLGDVCDPAPFNGTGGGGGGGNGSNAPPQFANALLSTNTSGGTIDVGYQVDTFDPDGVVDGISVAIVDTDNGSVVARQDYDPDSTAASRSGNLSATDDGGGYVVVVAAKDDSGAINQTSQVVVAAGGGDPDGDGVPSSVDDCPGVAGDGVNGCSSVSVDGDEAVVINESAANVTLLGTEVAELIDQDSAVRDPLDVVFVLDDSGSNGNHQHSLRSAGSTGGTFEVPADHTYVVKSDATRVNSFSSGTYTVPSGQVWTAQSGTPEWRETFDPAADGTTSEGAPTAWSTDDKGATPSKFSVQNDEFQISNTDGKMVVWRSESVDISNFSDIGVAVDIRGITSGGDDFDDGGPYGDTLKVQYVVDGTTKTITTRTDDISSAYETVTADGITGNTLQVVVTAETTGASETYAFDNVTVGNVSTYTENQTATFASPTQVQIDWRSDDGDRTFEAGETLTVFDDMTCQLYTQCSDPRDRLIVNDPGNDPSRERVEASKTFIDELNATAGDRAGAVEFTTGGSEIRGLGQSFGDLKNDIDNDIGAGGGTRIDRGLDAAIDEIENNGDDDNEKVIVLLSDGVNNDASQDGLTIDQAEEAANKNITIYTVGLSNGSDKPLLRDVANETGGEFYLVDNATGLEQKFAEIAGNVTEREPVKRLELKETAGAVEVGGNGTAETLSGLNDPSVDHPTTTIDLDNGSRVSLSASVYRCSSWSVTGNVSYNGTTYNKSDCDGSTTLVDVDNTTTSGAVSHKIYENGDTVPGLGSEWYRDDLESVVNDYNSTLIQGNQFNLTDDQAVFVLRTGGGNYSALLLEAEDSAPPGYSGSGPPTLSPPGGVGGGGGPGDVDPGNSYVIDIGFGEVVLNDD